MSDTRWLREEWARAWDTLPVGERMPAMTTSVSIDADNMKQYTWEWFVEMARTVLPDATIILLPKGEWRNHV